MNLPKLLARTRLKAAGPTWKGPVRMRRRIPALLGASLLLGGCATTQSPEDPLNGAESTSTATLDDAGGTGTAVTLPLGEWAPARCPVDQPCDVEFRITDIQVSEKCEFGLKPDAEPPAQDTWVITIYSEARSGLTADGKAHIFTSPEAIDQAGEVQPASYDQPCADNPANADFAYLLTGLDENSEARFADNFAVPAESQALLFEGYRIALPGAGESSGAALPEEPAQQPAGDTPVQGGGGASSGTGVSGAVAPTVVGSCDAEGQALFSDGVRRVVAACADQGGEPDPELPYRCAGTGEQVADPSDCVTATTPKPKPTQPPVATGTTTVTAPPPTRVVHPNPAGFANDYERELWTACANREVIDRLVCTTMYELYGRP